MLYHAHNGHVQVIPRGAVGGGVGNIKTHGLPHFLSIVSVLPVVKSWTGIFENRLDEYLLSGQGAL